MQRSDYDQWKASEVARLLALVEAERRYYQDLVSALPVPLAVLDPQLNFVAANREFRRRMGLAGAEIGRCRVEDVFGPEAAGALRTFQAGAEPHLATGGVASTQLSVQRVRGWEQDACDDLVVLVESPGGKASGTVSAAEAPPAWDSLPAAAWRMDTEAGLFVSVNERGRQLDDGGEAWRSLESRAGLLAPADRDRWLRFYRDELPRAGSGSIDYSVSSAGGLLLWRRDLAAVESTGAVAGITLDTTADHRDRRQQAEEAKREGLERLAVRLAHVANNLLMIVSGYGEEILNSFPEQDSRAADLKEIMKASERLALLTGDLNRLIRPRRYDAAPFSMRSWMQDALGLLQASLPGCAIRGAMPDEDLDLFTSREVLAGILSEAAFLVKPHLTEGGQLTLSASALTPDKAALWLRFPAGAVPAEVAAKFFEPFAGVKAGADPPLGLAAWIRPWRELGGTIFLEAEPGETPVLALTCPARSSGQAAVLPPAKVLVVEDEESIRTLIQRSLIREGFAVDALSTAREALEALRPPDSGYALVVTDINMPGMSGRELAEAASRLDPELRFLLMSGGAAGQRPDGGELPSNMSFLEKPFTAAALLERVRRLLG